jgi:hypothetical protein
MIKTLNSEVQAIFKRAEKQVIEAIPNRPELSYHAIANLYSVSVAFVNSCATKLRKETGFARAPKKVKQ